MFVNLLPGKQALAPRPCAVRGTRGQQHKCARALHFPAGLTRRQAPGGPTDLIALLIRVGGHTSTCVRVASAQPARLSAGEFEFGCVQWGLRRIKAQIVYCNCLLWHLSHRSSNAASVWLHQFGSSAALLLNKGTDSHWHFERNVTAAGSETDSLPLTDNGGRSSSQRGADSGEALRSLGTYGYF